MRQVFIVHGFGGHSQGGWFPWLVRKLNQDAVSAVSIPMPTPEYPVPKEWVEGISSWVGKPNKDIFLVGHSLGASAVLRYLESLKEDEQIGGVLLVASFALPLEAENPNSVFRQIDPFVALSFDFEKIKRTAKKFVVLHGEKDAIVPISFGQDLSEKLDADFIRVENGTHWSQKTPPICYELPEAHEALFRMMNS
jgi:predicted alpha/beta hydrolase family esterase